MPIRAPVWATEPDLVNYVGVCWALFRGHSAGTRPSSMAALISACKSVTPSEAVLMIRCAIFALVAGVRCDQSMRSTAVFSADLMIITSSGLNFGGGSLCISGSLRYTEPGRADTGCENGSRTVAHRARVAHPGRCFLSASRRDQVTVSPAAAVKRTDGRVPRTPAWAGRFHTTCRDT